MALRLAKLGYYGGNPHLIMKAPADMILNISNYEIFQNDLEEEYRIIYGENQGE